MDLTTSVCHGGSYGDTDLRWWADRIGEWHVMGRDVFAYFNNDADGNAVRNALSLRQMVGGDHRRRCSAIRV